MTYNLYGRAQGATAWVPLLTGTSATSYTSISGDGLAVTEGLQNEYYVEAYNKYGTGPASATGSITASSVPSQMSTVTTSNVNIYVAVTFSAPASNGASISEYEILILQSTGNGGQYISETAS